MADFINLMKKEIEENDPYTYRVADGTKVIKASEFSHANYKKIILPPSVEKIEAEAFIYSAIEEINLPDSITSIGSRAFYSCYYLKKIKIPSQVTCIEDSTFENCDNLEAIDIPKNVTKIGEYAFYACESLVNVSLPDRLKTINKYAFANCRSLNEIQLPESLDELYSMAFANTPLTTVYLPQEMEIIDDDIFDGSNLEKLFMPFSLTSLSKHPIGYSVDNIKIYIIPSFREKFPDFTKYHEMHVVDLTLDELLQTGMTLSKINDALTGQSQIDR